jgi:DTW domain-containing protein YfiP
VNAPDPAEETAGRSTCYVCFRPHPYCLCDSIPSVDNSTLVTIVQHPRERTHPFGTVRLAALGLRRSEVLVDHVGRLRRDPALLGSLEGAALLYPHARARDVTSLSPGERPRRLIVIDGTWHQARTLYRDIAPLHALPHLTLPGHLRSAFEIRRQPAEFCLSTIEAIVYALRALEPATEGLDRLLAAFGTMQRRQMELPRDAGRQRAGRRARASRAIPRSLVEDYQGLVVAYAESSSAPIFGGKRCLLACAAERPLTGERFQRLIAREELSAAHLAHLGFDEDARSGAVSYDRFCAEWAEFLQGGSVLCSWSQSTLDLLCDAAKRPRAGVALKGAYANLKRSRGSLEEIVRQEGLPAPRTSAPGTGRGRASARLQNALSLVEFLHRRGREPEPEA